MPLPAHPATPTCLTVTVEDFGLSCRSLPPPMPFTTAPLPPHPNNWVGEWPPPPPPNNWVGEWPPSPRVIGGNRLAPPPPPAGIRPRRQPNPLPADGGLLSRTGGAGGSSWTFVDSAAGRTEEELVSIVHYTNAEAEGELRAASPPAPAPAPNEPSASAAADPPEPAPSPFVSSKKKILIRVEGAAHLHVQSLLGFN